MKIVTYFTNVKTLHSLVMILRQVGARLLISDGDHPLYVYLSVILVADMI